MLPMCQRLFLLTIFNQVENSISHIKNERYIFFSFSQGIGTLVVNQILEVGSSRF